MALTRLSERVQPVAVRQIGIDERRFLDASGTFALPTEWTLSTQIDIFWVFRTGSRTTASATTPERSNPFRLLTPNIL
ncbi:hypothetical protein [Natronosalvus halobius]|uniref:hypothetical protein n=1 Tax=Natronosalvus halobius TaxID=2953746 RepID=UPI00209EB81E|nr:hypothetical protein [Natronosalvus halobius]USZ72026.1 hypothetical protein NGM15_01575 [Natronosalvus halobius]